MSESGGLERSLSIFLRQDMGRDRRNKVYVPEN